MKVKLLTVPLSKGAVVPQVGMAACSCLHTVEERLTPWLLSLLSCLQSWECYAVIKANSFLIAKNAGCSTGFESYQLTFEAFLRVE